MKKLIYGIITLIVSIVFVGCSKPNMKEIPLFCKDNLKDINTKFLRKNVEILTPIIAKEGEPFCVKGVIRQTQEELKNPRLVLFFHGDGNNVKYFDELISELKNKRSHQYEEANTIFVNFEHPQKYNQIALRKSPLEALAYAVAQTIQQTNPSYIDFVGHSGGGDRALMVAALSNKIWKKYGLKIPVDDIYRLNSACDRNIAIKGLGYGVYSRELYNPINHVYKIRAGVKVIAGRGTKDTHIWKSLYENSNNQCMEKLTLSGVDVKNIELKGAGHSTLGKSLEYRTMMTTLLDPKDDGYITTPEYIKSLEKLPPNIVENYNFKR